MGMKIEEAVEMVVAEYGKALAEYPTFNSAHEGYAVLLEEVDELKDEVWMSPAKRDPRAMRLEAAQVAAMAIRFLTDVCPPGGMNTDIDKLRDKLIKLGGEAVIFNSLFLRMYHD